MEVEVEVREWQQRGGARWPGRTQSLSCRLGRRKVEGRGRTGNVVAPTLCGQVKAEDLAGQGQRRAGERNIPGAEPVLWFAAAE
jgi:hypothetical protein